MTEPAIAVAKVVPERFGRYVLTDRIGSGGMAEVFRAVTFGSEGFRRIIVVKRIRRELSESADFLRMFFDEAKISARLHHKNIVQVYDFGQVDGQYFLAMEYLEGKDVATVLRRLRPEQRAISPALAAYVGHEAALGLQYVHTLRGADDQLLGIVHRDVSPANIMLLRTGGVKLLDFGIAVASDLADESETQTTILKGKLSYLSPEQASCRPLDARSDLFSWGATTWEMLTGIRLFRGKTDHDRLVAVRRMPVPAPSTLQPGIPKELDRIVLRSLERDRALRYQSAEELAGDLAAFLKVSAPPQDAVAHFLTALFGSESSGGTAAPRLAGLAATGDPSGVEDEFALPRDSGPTSSRPRVETAQALFRQRTLWVMASALVIAVITLTLVSLSGPTPQPAPSTVLKGTSGTDPMQADPAGAPPPGHVRIEVDSEPSGAQVSGSRGVLGTTPLVITLPISAESEQLRFEKAGYRPATSDVRPERPGVIFVELRPVRH